MLSHDFFEFSPGRRLALAWLAEKESSNLPTEDEPEHKDEDKIRQSSF